MSTLNRPKSPHTPTTIKKGEKEDSFWDKFSTLGRKRGTREGEPNKKAGHRREIFEIWPNMEHNSLERCDLCTLAISTAKNV